jgi:hypothetical protein
MGVLRVEFEQVTVVDVVVREYDAQLRVHVLDDGLSGAEERRHLGAHRMALGLLVASVLRTHAVPAHRRLSESRLETIRRIRYAC